MLRSSLIALAAAGALAAPAFANNIGSVAALNRDVEGTPPTATPRQLVLGDGVVTNEKIVSSPVGSGQLLFLDQTSLTVAKNSTIVLDKYVYDASTKTGEFALTMSRGVLRFVGGRITKTTDAVVTTPTATIGIRGGMAIIIVDEDGTTRVMHIAGEYTRVTRLGGDEIIISRNNGVVVVTQGGIEYVGVADREFVRSTSVDLIGRGEAGERVEPQDPDVVESGVPDANSEAKGAETDPPQSTRGEQARGAEGEDDEDRRFRPNDEEITTVLVLRNLPQPDEPTRPIDSPVLLPGVTGSASFSGATIPNLTSGPGGETFIFTQVFEGSRIGITADGEAFIIPTAPGFFTFDETEGESPNGGIFGSGFFDETAEFTYAVFQTRAGDTGAFLTGTPSAPLPNAAAGARLARAYAISPDLFTSSGPAFTSGGLTRFSAAGQSDLTLLSNAGGAATGGDAKALASYLQINGSGPNQTSGLGVYTSAVTDPGAGTPALSGFFDGFFRDSSGQIIRAETQVATLEDGAGASAFGPNAKYLALGNSDGVGGPVVPGRIVDEAGATTLFGTNNYATRLRQTQLGVGGALGGTEAAGGFAATSGVDLGTGDTYVGRSLGTLGAMLTVDPASNNAALDLRLDSFFTRFVSQNEAFDTPEIFNLQASFGGGDRGAAINSRRFAARQSADGVPAGNFVQGLQEPGVQPGQNAFSGVMASADLVGAGGIFPAGVDTTPQFMRWGWWAGEFRHDPNEIGNPQNEGIELSNDQRFHLGAWVAGDVTASANLPVVGVATYDGFAAVSIVENGAAYVDGAGFGMTYDFGQGVGTVEFTDIVGANAQIAVNQQSFGAHYSGAAGINVKGQAGFITVDGSFFNAGATPAGATGGSLALATNNGAISGAGVYAGDRTSFVNNRQTP